MQRYLRLRSGRALSLLRSFAGHLRASVRRTKSEYASIVFAMARRPDREKVDMLSEQDLKELRHNLAHLSLGAVRDFYEAAYRDCQMIYSRLPSPRQMQTLVQVWKQLRKWR
jgi:hypothetical protein